MFKWLLALVAVTAVALAATAAFACNEEVSMPPSPEVQAPPTGGTGS